MNARCDKEGAMTTLFINWTPRAIDLLKLVLRFMGV